MNSNDSNNVSFTSKNQQQHRKDEHRSCTTISFLGVFVIAATTLIGIATTQNGFDSISSHYSTTTTDETTAALLVESTKNDVSTSTVRQRKAADNTNSRLFTGLFSGLTNPGDGDEDQGLLTTIANLIAVTYCHNLQNGVHETISAFTLFSFIHRLHGDTRGVCGPQCASTICPHTPCAIDTFVSNNDQDCQCLADDTFSYDSPSLCGTNTVCNIVAGTTEERCACEPGYTGDPLLGCTCSGTGCTNGPGTSCNSNTQCNSGLSCAIASRQNIDDTSKICCDDSSSCDPSDQTSPDCCNGQLFLNDACSSTLVEDCNGSLSCGQRSRLNATFICCPETFFPSIIGSTERVCRVFPALV